MSTDKFQCFPSFKAVNSIPIPIPRAIFSRANIDAAEEKRQIVLGILAVLQLPGDSLEYGVSVLAGPRD